jgi:hypothetical protein
MTPGAGTLWLGEPIASVRQIPEANGGGGF